MTTTEEHLKRIEDSLKLIGANAALESLTALRSTIAEMEQDRAGAVNAMAEYASQIAALTAELSETKSAMEAYAAESDAFCERTRVLTAERDKAIRDLGEAERKIAVARMGQREDNPSTGRDTQSGEGLPQ